MVVLLITRMVLVLAMFLPFNRACGLEERGLDSWLCDVCWGSERVLT